MNLTKSQKSKVEQLFNEYKDPKVKKIDFKAPTGSGKTFMAAHFISKVFATNQNNKTMIIVATISDSELPKAFARKLENYKKYLDFKNFEVEFKKSPSKTEEKKVEQIKGFNLENNKVLIFGTASFGKKRLFTEQKILDSFIIEAKERNWNIIYIRDEAHKGTASKRKTKEEEYLKFEEKINDLASFVLQMTATPKMKNQLVELSVEELKEDDVNLLKEELVYNDFQKNSSSSIELIDECLNKFLAIQKKYQKLNKQTNIFIRPALLIQVDSKQKNTSLEEHEKVISDLINKIKKKNLNYLKYFSNDKEGNAKEDLTLESASRNDSNYDVIIFKVGPATGWDIPRACMLLQIREVSSETLNLQTIGRIKRNPMPGLQLNEITNKYYIYSNYQEGKRELLNYSLKQRFLNLDLKKGSINFKVNESRLIKENYIFSLRKFLNSKRFLSEIKKNKSKEALIIEEKDLIATNVGTQNIYKKYVKDIFRLYIWNKDNIKQNKRFFDDEVLNLLDDFCKEKKWPKQIVLYTLFYSFLDDIKKYYFKSINKNYTKSEYNTKHAKLTQYYSIWKSKEDQKKTSNNVDVSKIEQYGYRLIVGKNQKNQKNIQFLDSKPETIFLQEIINIIKKSKHKNQISFYAKMPTLGSDVYFEYWNSRDYEKHKAFIDFCLKMENNKILMIEVKSKNDDYDEAKTEDLIDAFAEYEKIQNIMKLKVAFVNLKNKTITIKHKNKFNETEETTIEDLIEEIFK